LFKSCWGSFLKHFKILKIDFKVDFKSNLYFKFTSNSDSDILNVASGMSGNDPTGWRNLMVTVAYDVGADTVIRVYNDASQVGISTSGLTGANQDDYSNSNNFFIGAYNNAGTLSGPITGNVSDWAIWNTTLDTDAITAVYNSGTPFDLTHDRGNYDNASDLVSYYKMNDGSGTTIVDSMGNSNGTLVADASFSASTPDD